MSQKADPINQINLPVSFIFCVCIYVDNVAFGTLFCVGYHYSMVWINEELDMNCNEQPFILYCHVQILNLWIKNQIQYNNTANTGKCIISAKIEIYTR